MLVLLYVRQRLQLLSHGLSWHGLLESRELYKGGCQGCLQF